MFQYCTFAILMSVAGSRSQNMSEWGGSVSYCIYTAAMRRRKLSPSSCSTWGRYRDQERCREFSTKRNRQHSVREPVRSGVSLVLIYKTSVSSSASFSISCVYTRSFFMEKFQEDKDLEIRNFNWNWEAIWHRCALVLHNVQLPNRVNSAKNRF